MQIYCMLSSGGFGVFKPCQQLNEILYSIFNIYAYLMIFNIISFVLYKDKLMILKIKHRIILKGKIT